MDQAILKILLYNSEGSTLDFKKEDYKLGKNPKKNDLLKDLIAFANHPSNQDKYIFIGVKEKNGMASEFFSIDSPLDDANYQEFVKNSIEPELQFEYQNFTHEGNLMGYFRIFGNNKRPYLFKKDIKKPGINQLEYKQGDGYIRIGTSTKKITRKDLEIIYENRFKSKDRKNDLKVNPIIGIPKKEFYDIGLRYLDIEIVNTSNKSIEFEVELEVYKSDDHLLITEKEMGQILRENHQNSISIFGASGPFIDVTDPFFTSKDNGDSIILSDLRAAQYRLAQRDSITDVFNQNLLLRVKRMKPVRGKIIIRSDDFTDGILEMDLTFDIPNIAQQRL
ncbi:AlbA family DNA-binding domain-containing protein [Zeaxanthinibacter enoshimensis]|uniref:Putative DNA-binding protein n=1 Tax=Zeaxanthinibacter enoshimensis TaxID=392009 RepID=A0A4R6TGS6_9FLAO|nr:ATP-binding protein [Zeaxanthinibacter enoshimensis]TDQ28141.1 putative DNA-binding protein [Zeaxanthinibacter enoshimensis]